MILETFNYLESLSGIETLFLLTTEEAKLLSITLNPYQGLKPQESDQSCNPYSLFQLP